MVREEYQSTEETKHRSEGIAIQTPQTAVPFLRYFVSSVLRYSFLPHFVANPPSLSIASAIVASFLQYAKRTSGLPRLLLS